MRRDGGEICIREKGGLKGDVGGLSWIEGGWRELERDGGGMGGIKGGGEDVDWGGWGVGGMGGGGAGGK